MPLRNWANALPLGKRVPFAGGGHLPVIVASCAAMTGLACIAFALEHASARDLPGTFHNHDWETKNRSYEKYV